jgi:hypothetical protein
MREIIRSCNVCGEKAALPEPVPVRTHGYTIGSEVEPVGWIAIATRTTRPITVPSNAPSMPPVPIRTTRALTHAIAPHAVGEVDEALAADVADLAAYAERTAPPSRQEPLTIEGGIDVCPRCVAERPAEAIAAMVADLDATVKRAAEAGWRRGGFTL